MRILPCLFLVASVSLAQGRRMPQPEQIEEVRKIVGDQDWGLMAEWRRRDVVHRYLRFLDAPEKKQEAIRAVGLKQYLTTAGRRRGRKLPAELQREIEQLDPKVRPLAHKLAYVRLRQLRLDRNLSLLPQAQRRAWFQRLFPEPFDPRAAREGRLAFEKQVARAVAAALRPQLQAMSEFPSEKRRDLSRKLVRQFTKQREQQVIQAVAKSVRRFRAVSPERGQRSLPPDLELLLDRREVFATPRQRELVRWSLRPAECPILDFSWLGERPTEKTARRRWERDFAALGRLELLSEAGLPREVVLHLAAATTDEDFVQAVRRLMGRSGPAPRDRNSGASR